MDNKVNIRNKKATFEYELVDTYVAGIQLRGTEIKAIRDSKASISEAYCYFRKGELLVKNMNIGEYGHGNINNHDPLRLRKLLLNKRELNKLEAAIKNKGLTIIPLRLFISQRGFAKLEIALARGKKVHDKRHSIKEKDQKREIDRMMRQH